MRRTVTGIVAVTVHECDFNAIVKKVSQILNLTAADICACIIANTLKSFINAVGGLGVVNGNTQRGLDVMLREVAEIVVRWERRRIDGGDVVVVAAGLVDVLALDLVGAIDVCGHAGLVDGGIVPGCVGVSFVGQAVAFEDEGFAARVWAVEVIEGLLVEGLVDCLDAVGVIVGEFGVEGFLDEEIDAAVDDTESVEVDDVFLSFLGDGFVGDTLVLLLEESGECRAIASTILVCCQTWGFSSREIRAGHTDSVKIEMASLFGL